MLNPTDSERLLSVGDWQLVRQFPVKQVGGAGAGLPHYVVPSMILLPQDDGRTEALSLDIWIAEPGRQNAGLESLLGRDVLQHYESVFVGVTELRLEPLSDAYTA